MVGQTVVTKEDELFIIGLEDGEYSIAAYDSITYLLYDMAETLLFKNQQLSLTKPRH